jgi:hypothetical protein
VEEELKARDVCGLLISQDEIPVSDVKFPTLNQFRPYLFNISLLMT